VAEAHGVTYDKWNSLGGLQSDLGGPVQDTTAVDDGQLTRFKHGTVGWSPATDAHVLRTLKDLWNDQGLYIAATGQSLPATIGILGFPTMDETDTADGRAQFCEFQNGTGIHINGGDAVEIHGPIRDLWLSEGGFSNPLGLPTSSVLSTPDGTGQYSFFENGAIGATAANGAHAIAPGVILDLWSSHINDLGMPTTDQAQSAHDLGVRYQGFQTGLVFVSYGAGGKLGLSYLAQEIHGPIWQKWVELGGLDSNLGAPVTGETATADGAGSYAYFEGGSIFCKVGQDAHVLMGAVSDKFFLMGAETSYLGFPTTDTVATRDGRGLWAQFEGGDIFWSPDAGTGAHDMRTAIWDKWGVYNWDLGILGCPTTDTVENADGSRYSDFQHGTIFWSAAQGALALHSWIWVKWNSLGRPSYLGNPRTDVFETFQQTGQFANFEYGAIFSYNSSAAGTQEVHGDIYTKWVSMGCELGALGYPTSDEIDSPDGLNGVSYFQEGEIDRSPGVVQARVRFGLNNEFNFGNDIKFHVTAPLVMDAYGGQSYYDVFGVRVPEPETVAFTAYAMLNGVGSGACFGMALASLDFYHHPEWINGDYGLAPGAPPTTRNLMANGNLIHFIETQHLFQLSSEVIGYYLNWQVGNHTSAGLRTQIQDFLAAYDPPIINLHESLDEGHAVVATGLEAGDGPDDYYIDTYDANRPGARHDARIHVFGDNRWTFTMDSGAVWSGGFGELMVLPYEVVAQTQTLPTSLDGLVGIVFDTASATPGGNAAGVRLGMLPGGLFPAASGAVRGQLDFEGVFNLNDTRTGDRFPTTQGAPQAPLDSQPLPPKVAMDVQAVDSIMQDLDSLGDAVWLNPEPLPPK
jgi:uncharacterized protein with LGFP repeats